MYPVRSEIVQQKTAVGFICQYHRVESVYWKFWRGNSCSSIFCGKKAMAKQHGPINGRRSHIASGRTETLKTVESKVREMPDGPSNTVSLK